MMRLTKVPVDSDLMASSLEWAVNVFVTEYGCCPKAVIGPNLEYHKEVAERAREMQLAYYSLPDQIHLKQDAWVVVGENGDTVWSPGA